MNRLLLENKTILVTGAGTGIGRAVACGAAREGAVVLLAGRTEKTLLETQELIQEEGGQAERYVVDVTKDEQVKKLAEQVLEKYGHLDVLVNNAGISKEYPLIDMPIEVWDEIYNTNLRSVMLVTKAFLPSMAERKSGNIVNIGSGAALRGLPGSIAYSVSKAGVVCFTRTLGDEVRKFGIRTNVICPGPVDTELFQKSEAREFILKAGGDIFTPETIANAVVYLASDLSEGMSSQVLTLRGFNRW